MSRTLIMRALLALAALGVVAAAFELAAERHWQSGTQLIAWGVLAVLGIAVLLALVNESPRTLAAVRLLAVVVLLGAVYGIYAHIAANYDAGPLDERYAATWDTLPVLSHWWYALIKSVGPAPPLAPGALGESALVLLLATCVRRR